jgi:hypothetical protein
MYVRRLVVVNNARRYRRIVYGHYIDFEGLRYYWRYQRRLYAIDKDLRQLSQTRNV